MAFKNVITAGALALSMATAAVAVAPAPAEAKTKVVIGIGTGWGPGFGNCWNRPYRVCGWRNHPRVIVPIYGGYYGNHQYPKYTNKVGCGVAKDVLRGNGYTGIVAKDCSGKSYSFKANKHGKRYIVRFNAMNGHITGASRI